MCDAPTCGGPENHHSLGRIANFIKGHGFEAEVRGKSVYAHSGHPDDDFERVGTTHSHARDWLGY